MAKALRQNSSGALLPPVRVAVTGAAGAIGYSLVYRIARFAPSLRFRDVMVCLVLCVAGYVAAFKFELNRQ